MTHEYAKELIKEYLCSKKSVIYFPCEIDFIIFQNAYIEIISRKNLTKVMKTSTILTDVQTFAEFKEIVLKADVEFLCPGIEKQTSLFKEKYYFPDYQRLIQNIINECEMCNLAKTEHRDTKLTFELTPETFNPREKYVIDFYMIDNKQFLFKILIF